MVFPYPHQNYQQPMRSPGVVPFTMQDGATFWEILRNLWNYLDGLVDSVNTAHTEWTQEQLKIIEQLKDEVAVIITSAKGDLAEQIAEQAAAVAKLLAEKEAELDGKITDLTAYVNAEVDKILNASIETNDAIINANINNPNSETSKSLDDFVKARTIRSVNGKTERDIVLSHSDVGAIPVEDWDKIVREASYAVALPVTRKISPLLSVPAVPSVGYWPSGYVFDRYNNTHLYVFYERENTQLIIRYDIATARELDRRTIINEQGISSTENSVLWYDSGDVMLLVRTKSGSTYQAYNYTRDRLGVDTAIDGAFKCSEYDGVVYTCDARTTTGGVGEVYGYDANSVKMSRPSKISTIPLEKRNMYPKSQGMCVDATSIWFAMGRSNHVAGVSRYTRTGAHVESYTFDPKAFGEAVLNKFPTLAYNPREYKHETEGCDLYNGVFTSGHTMRGSDISLTAFVIIAHGAGVDVPVTAIAGIDTGTGINELQVDSSVTLNGTLATLERTGDIVTMTLEFTSTRAITTTQLVAILPSGFRPRQTTRLVERGSKVIYNVTATPGGLLRIDALSESIANATWLPISMSFRGGNGMAA